MIRVGILGTGLFCRTAHIPSILNRGDQVDITGVYNRGEENRSAALRLLADHGRSPRVFVQPDDLCESPQVDAVLLCLPPEMHVPLAIKAIGAGKHIFCEKPISNTLDGARRLAGYAKHVKTVFHVGFVIRYSNLFSAMLSLIDDGEIGIPKVVWSRAFFASDWPYREGTWTNDPLRSGDTLNSWGVHAFDLLQAMARGYPQSCHATGGHMVRKDTENTDVAFANIIYDSGVIGSLQLCRFAPRGDDWWIGCIGTHGMIEAGFFQRQIILRHENTHKIIEPPVYGYHSFDGMQQQMDRFINAIEFRGQTATGVREGYYATATACCAKYSMCSKSNIDIPSMP
ncbi:MAG: Gfo/Idh/MocA family oxidoreductase [Candidatus Auribacterota bacterium]|jgi:myo-inositol 2-dehydrogenase/D-chiro-inositol 1-dehydrogenase|nr:Gfo/Idh/MocA family oxidoreductase [Candidatus Auribacterota bacterium]